MKPTTIVRKKLGWRELKLGLSRFDWVDYVVFGLGPLYYFLKMPAASWLMAWVGIMPFLLCRQRFTESILHEQQQLVDEQRRSYLALSGLVEQQRKVIELCRKDAAIRIHQHERNQNETKN